jgi:hypothetical protein
MRRGVAAGMMSASVFVAAGAATAAFGAGAPVQ